MPGLPPTTIFARHEEAYIIFDSIHSQEISPADKRTRTADCGPLSYRETGDVYRLLPQFQKISALRPPEFPPECALPELSFTGTPPPHLVMASGEDNFSEDQARGAAHCA